MTTQARELAKLVSNSGDLNFIDDIALGSDGAVLTFGADSEITLTHVHNNGLLLNSTKQLQFGDAGTYIHQSADGVLDLVSDTEIELNATTIDINGAVDVSGTVTAPNFTGTASLATAITITANNTADETVFPVFVDGATGTQGLETDTGFTYNPNTNTLSVVNLSVSGTNTIVDSVTMDANNAVIFEGSSADAHETTLTSANATADRTITLPNLTGTVSLLDASETLTNKTLTSPVISTITNSGNFTLDVEGDINFDANGSDITLLDGGTEFGRFKQVSNGMRIATTASDAAMTFYGNDGGQEITALTLNMEAAGRALFNEGIRLSGLNGGTGLAFDMAGSGDYTIKESSTDDVMSFQGHLFHNFSNGRLGIGTAAPQGLLHLDEGSADDCQLICETHAGGDSMILWTQGNSGPAWAMGLDSGSGTADGLSIAYKGDGFPSLTSQSKVVITTAGNLGIGNTAPAQKLHVGGGVRFSTTGADGNETRFNFGIGGAADDPTLVIYRHDGSSESVRFQPGSHIYFENKLLVGTTSTTGMSGNGIESNGSIRANNYILSTDLVGSGTRNLNARSDGIITTSTSLRELKENIVDMSLGLSDVLKLKPREFDWKKTPEGENSPSIEGDTEDIGFIADEVFDVSPKLTTYKEGDKNKDNLQGVKYDTMTSLLVKAIQEQQTIIEDLKTRIETLEG